MLEGKWASHREEPHVEITSDELPDGGAVVEDAIDDNSRDAIDGGGDIRIDDLLDAAEELKEPPPSEYHAPKIAEEVEARVKNLKNLKVKTGPVNFESMTEAQAYDLDIPIVAKPFSNEDSLDCELKDQSYVPRWVNVNPMRLGSMRARGFIYVVEADLAKPLNIEIEVDAQGHYRCNDVVLMRITKERYYGALRAAHLRAISAVSATGAHKAAASVANQFMEKEAGGEYVDYASRGKVKFYTTGG